MIAKVMVNLMIKNTQDVNNRRFEVIIAYTEPNKTKVL